MQNTTPEKLIQIGTCAACRKEILGTRSMKFKCACAVAQAVPNGKVAFPQSWTVTHPAFKAVR